MTAYGQAQLRSWATSRHRGTVALRVASNLIHVTGPLSTKTTPARLVQEGLQKRYELRIDVRRSDLPMCPKPGKDSITHAARTYLVDEVQGWDNEWATVVTIRASVSFD